MANIIKKKEFRTVNKDPVTQDQVKQGGNIDYDKLFDYRAFKTPNTYIVRPTVNDYNRQFIYRYFAIKNTNPQTITEISPQDFSGKEQFGPNYSCFKLAWVIVGEEESVFNNNRNTVLKISEKYPEVKKYFTNYLQFYR